MTKRIKGKFNHILSNGSIVVPVWREDTLRSEYSLLFGSNKVKCTFLGRSPGILQKVHVHAVHLDDPCLQGLSMSWPTPSCSFSLFSSLFLPYTVPEEELHPWMSWVGQRDKGAWRTGGPHCLTERASSLRNCKVTYVIGLPLGFMDCSPTHLNSQLKRKMYEA